MSGGGASGRPGRGILRSLGWLDFRLLWAGQAVSLLGNGVTTVALAWQAYELSPRATLSLVLLARAIPMIGLLLVSGWGPGRSASGWSTPRSGSAGSWRP